ncbi:hypothetical protein JX265_012203 [Neoarthrinium moseri]|uniref:Zn(2)-C6 fungal-type domain-containing protein n=1 Tax=Neoarthrinium moseri TaxID=1658444 RepID=A0A9P9WAK0_9PEZI|nr:hypothetical protein JX265_012203 [Neoarthrinium moseri]
MEQPSIASPAISHSASAAAVDLTASELTRAKRHSHADGSPDSLTISEDLSPRSPKRRKILKVTRACDFCKQRKAKCSGTIPCDKCSKKGRTCLYDAKYSRGHPPEPTPSLQPTASSDLPDNEAVMLRESAIDSSAAFSSEGHRYQAPVSQGPASRASPELGVAEIEGQIFDPTSGITFLERAQRRLSRHDKTEVTDGAAASADRQPLMSAGDKPLPQLLDGEPPWLSLPSDGELRGLMALYFDVCIATYRVVHRPSVESWLATLVSNIHQQKPLWQDVGRARAAMVLAALAIATAHQDKSMGFRTIEDEEASLRRSDRLFCVSSQLTDGETGFPKLESAQARIIQVLYLLTTSRMNHAWFTFGVALQIISALGMHRKSSRKRRMAASSTDYMQEQCRIRTFWTAYILDKYLGVILGRPRHFHDDDVDQDFPDSIDDENMTPQGPVSDSEYPSDTFINALVFHARIAQIIGSISREVYSTKKITEKERAAAAQRLSEKLHQWKASLPPHLGSIRPSMLIAGFRRQATVLKLAYSHAIMHANRLFLLGNLNDNSRPQIIECIGAAMDVFQAVDRMAAEGPIFHAFWWTQYVTFCALLVAYVWDIQLKRRGGAALDLGLQQSKLMALAERCHTHLAMATATNSPSRRYAIILEELRSEALGKPVNCQEDVSGQGSHERNNGSSAQAFQLPATTGRLALQNRDVTAEMQLGGHQDQLMMADAGFGFRDTNLLDEWQTTDWLELDSSAFGLYNFDNSSSFGWMPNIGA